jgi:hypothetical protein
MNKLIFFFLPLFFLASCGGEEVDETTENTDDETEVEGQETETEFFNRSRREVIAKLKIPANENFKMQVYREEINSDTITDAIITVNRLDYAMEQAIKSGKQAKMAQIGFMGNYNYFLYYDGATGQFSVPIPVPSTPGRPLDVTFEHILSPVRKDVIIEYRVLNSGYKSYFSVFNERDLLLVFQWKYFENAGDDVPTALLHKIVEQPNSRYKDIYIYNSEIDNYNKNIGDMYQYTPKITKEKEILYKFTFDPRFTKYRLIK